MSDQQGNVAVCLTGLTKRFAKYTAVEGITIDVREGTFLSIVGPSGCGKSTILNMTAGLMTPSDGTVDIYGQRLVGLNRRAAYMFQQDALLPWRTVLDNVVMGLTFRRQDRRAAQDLGRMWLKRVGLENFADRYPHQLSGGMRKRVAMAQSWIVDPDILLMDEPFGALDVQTRQLMEGELLDLWSASRKTALFITHDLEEAIGLSDEIVVLSAGPGSRIVGRYSVDLPRPRNLIDIRTQPHFGELYRQIWSDLREEVLKSYERSQTTIA